jgi:hypothetical protein
MLFVIREQEGGTGPVWEGLYQWWEERRLGKGVRG